MVVVVKVVVSMLACYTDDLCSNPTEAYDFFVEMLSSETLVWAGTGPSGLAPGSSKAPMTSCFYSLNVATL